MSVLSVGLVGAGSGGYQIPRSLRLRSSASAYLQRTLTTPTNNLKWTWSGWVKRGAMGAQVYLFNTGSNIGGQDQANLQFSSGDQLVLLQTQTVTATIEVHRQTTQVFRDPSAWYHIVAVYDSANATAADRAQLWVNGSRVTSFAASVDPSSSLASRINAARVHTFGRFDSPQGYFDGYLSEVNFIDGQALTPSSFGETSATTGQWQAKKYTGTYGTNGFYLPFSDTTSTTTIVADSSGNGNNWTATNISLTAGATYDSMTDVPLGGGGSLGNGQGNYCVLNPVRGTPSGGQALATITDGNLKAAQSALVYVHAIGSMGVTSGKWYWEYTVVANAQVMSVGIATQSWVGGLGANGWFYHYDGTKYSNGANSAYGASYTANDVLGFALDLDAGTLVCYKNNSSQGTLVSSLSGEYFAAMTVYNTGSGHFNFGQRPFAYTPPTGFKALHTGNLSAPAIAKPNQHFDVDLYTGTSASQNRTGFAFKPDMVWTKLRNTNQSNSVYNGVTGVNTYLQTDSTGAEQTVANSLTSFNADGYTLGSFAGSNLSPYVYVGWLWKGGNGTVSNTNGTVTSTVSANPTAGFSVVTYTGTGANATVGHGLGVAPKMVIVKSRNTAGTAWPVYHASLANTQTLTLHSTSAVQTVALWGNTTPTSAVFTVSDASGTNGDTNFSGRTYVAYCFAEIAGFSKFGSYTGNASADGPFVYCGFRPRYVMIKCSDGTGVNWVIEDSARAPYNLMTVALAANSALQEFTLWLDFTANGFKIRETSANINSSGLTYVFAAFAESPFQSALAR